MGKVNLTFRLQFIKFSLALELSYLRQYEGTNFMVTIFYKNLKSRHLKTLETFKIGSWVYVEDPTDQEIARLSEDFKLEEDLLKDATDIFEAPRIEQENGTIYLFTQFVSDEEINISTIPVLFVINDSFFLSLSKRPLPFLERLKNEEIEFYTTQKNKLLLQLLLQTNISYNQALHQISRKIRSISVNLEKINNKDIVQFVSFEAILNDFLSDLVPTNTVLTKLLSGRLLKLYEEDKDLVEDLLLSNNQLIELSRSNLKTIVNIREAYSTIMTNNLNRVIKLFTSLTVLLTIPTMVASIYGMNVKLPYADSPDIFSYIIASIILISSLLLVIFIRKDWL